LNNRTNFRKVIIPAFLILIFLVSSVILLCPPSKGKTSNAQAKTTGKKSSGSGSSGTGWSKDAEGQWHYRDGSGNDMTGWLQLDNKWYYLNSSGVMQTGWKKLHGRWYYFKKNGAMATGWNKWRGKWYYFKDSGIMATGWVKAGGKWYYMDDSGIMLRDQVISYKGENYYIKPNGALAADCSVTVDGLLRYADKNGVIKSDQGYILSDGKLFLADSDGVLCTDQLVNYDGSYYYLRENGEGEYLEDQLAAQLAVDLNMDLEAAMNFAGMKIIYKGKGDFDKSWGTTKLAEYGIQNREGNCYVYAAVFRDLAYSMGYDAHQISGYVKMPDGAGAHSWVEIDIDGDTYVCDPAGLYQQGMEKAYMFHYKDKGTWVYSDYERMN